MSPFLRSSAFLSLLLPLPLYVSVKLILAGIDDSCWNPASSRINYCLGCLSCRMHGSSGCLGKNIKPQPVSSVREPLKGQKFLPQSVSKPKISEDFWTTSTCGMDNSAFQSQGSISSISTSNQTLDTLGTSSANITSEFVNHGLLLWSQSRQQWIAKKKSVNRGLQPCEPKLSWNATYDSLLGSNKPFPKPVPLSEMVDFLVDIWEQEGMYD